MTGLRLVVPDAIEQEDHLDVRERLDRHAMPSSFFVRTIGLFARGHVLF